MQIFLSISREGKQSMIERVSKYRITFEKKT